MTYPTAALNAYQRDAILSASPGRLITMLYDRLMVDLHRAAAEQHAEDWSAAGLLLRHAQDIVTELAASLDTSQWRGGERLAAVYDHVIARLIHANIHRDATATAEVIALCEPLRQTWHEVVDGAAVATGAVGVA